MPRCQYWLKSCHRNSWVYFLPPDRDEPKNHSCFSIRFHSFLKRDTYLSETGLKVTSFYLIQTLMPQISDLQSLSAEKVLSVGILHCGLCVIEGVVDNPVLPCSPHWQEQGFPQNGQSHVGKPASVSCRLIALVGLSLWCGTCYSSHWRWGNSLSYGSCPGSCSV